jgi:hypothetical protein
MTIHKEFTCKWQSTCNFRHLMQITIISKLLGTKTTTTVSTLARHMTLTWGRPKQRRFCNTRSSKYLHLDTVHRFSWTSSGYNVMHFHLPRRARYHTHFTHSPDSYVLLSLLSVKFRHALKTSENIQFKTTNLLHKKNYANSRKNLGSFTVGLNILTHLYSSWKPQSVSYRVIMNLP